MVGTIFGSGWIHISHNTLVKLHREVYLYLWGSIISAWSIHFIYFFRLFENMGFGDKLIVAHTILFIYFFIYISNKQTGCLTTNNYIWWVEKLNNKISIINDFFNIYFATKHKEPGRFHCGWGWNILLKRLIYSHITVSYQRRDLFNEKINKPKHHCKFIGILSVCMCMCECGRVWDSVW